MGERQLSLAVAGFGPLLALLPLTSSFVTLADYEPTAAPDMEDQRRAVEDHTVNFNGRWS